MTPNLSVILANHNHGHHLSECLTAVLSQSQPPDEVVVVDDGSTDDSVPILQSLAQRHPQIRLLRNPTNCGAVYSYHRALHAAQGEFLYAHAADDRVLPGFFEKCITMLRRHPYAALCTSFCSTLDARTGERHERPVGWSDQPRYFSPSGFAAVLEGASIPGHATLCRREALMAAGGFLPELRWYCDWFIYLVLAARQGICFVPEALALWRQDPASYSGGLDKTWDLQKEALVRVMRLLASPAFADVAPFFARSRALAIFGPAMPRAVAETPGLWSRTTYALLAPAMSKSDQPVLAELCLGAHASPAEPPQVGDDDLADLAGHLRELQERLTRDDEALAALMRVIRHAGFSKVPGDTQAAVIGLIPNLLPRETTRV